MCKMDGTIKINKMDYAKQKPSKDQYEIREGI